MALLATPGSPAHRDLRKGLDLQGGLEVVLQAEPKPPHRLTPGDLDRSVAVMRERIDKIGVAEPELRKQGTNQIVIQLPAVHDPDQAARIVGQTAQLELYDLESSLAPPSIDAAGNPVAHARLYDLLARVQSGQRGKPSAYWLFATRTKRLVAGPAVSETSLRQSVAGSGTSASRIPCKWTTCVRDVSETSPRPGARYEVLTTPGDRTVVTCSLDTGAGLPRGPHRAGRTTSSSTSPAPTRPCHR